MQMQKQFHTLSQKIAKNSQKPVLENVQSCR